MERFRFGYQISSAPNGLVDVRRAAREAEAAGFDVIHCADHVSTGWPPLAPLAVALEATETLRACPLVLNNDFHHPVHLAREIAALDHLSGGRVELGIGAGHSFTEYAAIGQAFDPPAVRKARLAEAVEIMRRLLDGEEVTYAGQHYQLDGVRTMRAQQDRLPILVGVNGDRALAHAAVHADVVAPTMLGRTLADGHDHEVRWQAERLDRTVAHISEAAGDRTPAPRLHALVQAVEITDDRRGAAERWAGELDQEVDDILATPFLAFGTHAQIAEHLEACRDRWGIAYFSVRDIAAFAPVIARLATATR